jgi:hypothetical protein
VVNNQESPGTAFLAMVATLMSGTTAPSAVGASSEYAHEIIGSTRIEAETMRWMMTGDALFAGEDPSARALLTVGDAIALVQVVQPGTHRITARVQDTPPAPVTFQLESDFERLGQFSAQRGDMSWQEFSVEGDLEAGTHIIGLRFLNDAQVNGADRNLIVDWLQIEPIR